MYDGGCRADWSWGGGRVFLLVHQLSGESATVKWQEFKGFLPTRYACYVDILYRHHPFFHLFLLPPLQIF